MHPELLPRRRRQPTPGPRVARRRVRQERRHPVRQEPRRLGDVPAPPLRRPGHDRLPALGRRDERPRRHDVGHRLVTRVPDTGPHLHRARGHCSCHDLRLESRQVGPPAPTPHHGDDVTVAAPEHRHRACDRRRRAWSLHRHLDVRDAEPEAGPGQLAEEVATPLGLGAGHQPDVQRDVRQSDGGVAAQQSLGLQRGQQLGPLCRQPAHQRRDVDVGQDEAQLASRPVQVERPAQHHDHPVRQLDALLGQRVSERCPRRAPALDLQDRLAAPCPASAPASRARFLLRVHQVQVQMTRPAVVRQILDLPPHPQVPPPGEGLGQRRLDLVVEAADREDAGPLRGVRRLVARPDILRRRLLGIEELAGAAGSGSGATKPRKGTNEALRPRYRCPVPVLRYAHTDTHMRHSGHPVLTTSGDPHLPTGRRWQTRYDGESAGWPRPGPAQAGIVSRKVGTPQSRVLAKPVEVTRRTVPQKTNRRWRVRGAGPAQVRVKRCGKSAPATGVTPPAR